MAFDIESFDICYEAFIAAIGDIANNNDMRKQMLRSFSDCLKELPKLVNYMILEIIIVIKVNENNQL